MRHVLVVTYYFPPAGGSGVQRGLKFVKFLPEFGYQPTVLTVAPDFASYPDLDESLEREIPPGVKIVRTRAWDPYRWYAAITGKEDNPYKVGSLGGEATSFTERLSRWIRANVFIPDARLGWVPFGYRAGRKIIGSQRPDIIFTSGPPHSTHAIGSKLARTFDIPWIADFRDLWTQINYYDELPHTAWARILDERKEGKTLETADAVTTVSPYCQKALVGRTTRSPENIHVVYNGYDESDFNDLTGQTDSEKNHSSFRLAYVGTLPAGQNPEGLWEVLGRLFRENRLPELEIMFTGRIDAVVAGSLRDHGLENVTVQEAYVPHAVAIERMRDASLLLLTIKEFEGASGTVTGKLFEYLAAGKPILGVGPSVGDASELIRKFSAGDMFDHGDLEGMQRYILNAYDQWRKGAKAGSETRKGIEKYSRRGQTRELAGIFDEVIARSEKSG